MEIHLKSKTHHSPCPFPTHYPSFRPRPFFSLPLFHHRNQMISMLHSQLVLLWLPLFTIYPLAQTIIPRNTKNSVLTLSLSLSRNHMFSNSNFSVIIIRPAAAARGRRKIYITATVSFPPLPTFPLPQRIYSRKQRNDDFSL